MTDDPKRQPIQVDCLLFADPKGITLPHGPTGDNVQLTPRLKAGMNNDIRVQIEYRPWMRAFRVARMRKLTREDKGKEVVTFEPMGKPFFIPEAMCVWVPVEDV